MQSDPFEEKFNALALFFNAAAHELRTPVTTGKIYLQLLQEKLKDSDGTSAVEDLFKVEAQFNKLNLLISNILDVSRMHAGKFKVSSEEVEINELIRQAAESRRSAYSKHSIDVSGSTQAIVNGNKERISQILYNLLDNAAKFSAAGKQIRIEISETDDQVCITVKDEGKGILPEDSDRVFHENYKAEKGIKSSGLGIGLYVSKRIAEEMNASLSAKNTEQGAAFTLALKKITAP